MSFPRISHQPNRVFPHVDLRGTARLPSIARPYHPPPFDAPRRVACPSEHILIVRVLRAKKAPGRSLPLLLRPRVARAQKIISLHPIPPLEPLLIDSPY